MAGIIIISYHISKMSPRNMQDHVSPSPNDCLKCLDKIFDPFRSMLFLKTGLACSAFNTEMEGTLKNQKVAMPEELA